MIFSRDIALAELRENGFYKIESFFTSEEILSIENQLRAIYDTIDHGCQIDLPGNVTPNSYSTGKSMRLYPAAYHLVPEISKFYDESLSSLSDEFFGGCRQRGLQVFSSYEYLSIEEVNSLPRNSYMHVDPYHALKFISHTCDVDKTNGSLQVIPKTTWIGEAIRKESSIESLLSSDAYTFEKSNYYDKKLEEEILYVSAKAGDLIILNTDVMHCGGILEQKNLKRISINFHNRK